MGEATKTAAIVIDDWKLSIFKKTLDKEGYEYTQHPGITPCTITLKVTTDSIAKLQPIVERMNVEAAESKKSPKTCLTDGSEVTPDHKDLKENGQQKGYVVLCPEERAKGYVRPLRYSYVHKECGSVTTMAHSIAETYARDPKFYNGTYCGLCASHFPLDQFVWDGTDDVVGS